MRVRGEDAASGITDGEDAGKMEIGGDMECKSSYEEAIRELEQINSTIKLKSCQSNVPCNGCTLCCQGDAIRILPEDDASQYQTIPHEHFPGQLMLDHAPNGNCVYLGDDGCLIHNRKPQMCKEMDCRNLARTIKRKDLKRYNLPLRVWKRGRQMIGRSY